MSRSTLSSILTAGAALVGLGALATLIPYQGSMMGDLGYYSLCPFAPYSTLSLLSIAGIIWAVRGHVNRQPAK